MIGNAKSLKDNVKNNSLLQKLLFLEGDIMKRKHLLLLLMMFVCVASISLTVQRAVACAGYYFSNCGCDPEYCDPDENHYDCYGNSQATTCVCTDSGVWGSCDEIASGIWCNCYDYYDAACEEIFAWECTAADGCDVSGS